MRKFVSGIFCAALMLAASSALASETFEIQWTCNEPAICTMQAGPYGYAVATVNGEQYTAHDLQSNSTCCQLAAEVYLGICDAGQKANGVVVTCEKGVH